MLHGLIPGGLEVGLGILRNVAILVPIPLNSVFLMIPLTVLLLKGIVPLVLLSTHTLDLVHL